MSNKKVDTNLRISILITLCFVLAGLVVYYVKNMSYSKEVILQKANNYYIGEQYFLAAKYYAKAIELKAADADMLRNYGIVLTKLGNYDSAIKYLKLSEEADRYNFETYYCIGNAYYQKAKVSNNADDFIASAKYLEKAINLSPDTEKSYLLIGLCYRSCGLQENARAWYRRALLSGNFSQAGFYNLIGHTFREEERYKDAISYYKRATSADYSFVAAYCNVGDMYLKCNESNQALYYYEKAIEVNENYIVPYIRIGSLYADQGKYDEAIPWYLHALNINSDNEKANYLIGIAYKEIGRKNDAVTHLKAAAFRGSDDAVYELRNIGVELK